MSKNTTQIPEKSTENVAIKPIIVNKDDPVALKRTLDDLVVEYFTLDKKYLQDNSVSNAKILVAFASVSLALLAQFWPEPFPHNWLILVICVTGYAILANLVFYYLLYYKEKDIIFTSKSGEPDLIQVHSNIKKWEYDYHLSMENLSSKFTQSVVKPFGNYFDENGRLAPEPFKADLARLLGDVTGNKKRK